LFADNNILIHKWFSFSSSCLIFAARMNNTTAYKLKHVPATLVMFCALAWLTISLPYVYSFQQELSKQQSNCSGFESPIGNEESNPFGNGTEEKAPTTASEEYIHHTDDHNYLFCYTLGHDNRHAYDIYVAYHGEVQCPPPNFI
jgi:hypothetical protein